MTAGIQTSALVPGRRDSLGRLHVDELLQLPESPGVLAAGDTAAAEAEPGHLVMQSCSTRCRSASTRAHNAAADLLGLPLTPFRAKPSSTCLDLGAAGAVITGGWDRVRATGCRGQAAQAHDQRAVDLAAAGRT